MKTIKALKLIILLSLVQMSCNQNEFPLPPDKGDNYIYINIANDDLTPSTKGVAIAGVDSLKENQLESLYILMYNKTRDERLLINDVYVETGDPNWANGMVGIEYNALNDFDENDSIQVFVIANISELSQRIALQACNTVEEIIGILDQYEYNRHLSLSGSYFEPADAENARPFLMEAHDEVLMNPNRYPFVSLTLKRLAVKIKIKVILDQPMISEAQNDPGFNRWAGEDMQYTVVRTPSVSRLVNTGFLCDPEERNYVITGYKAFNYNLADSIDESIFYALENDWNDNSVDETYLRLTIPYYNDLNQRVDTNFYKIRFNESSLKRNDFYSIEVSIKQLGSSEANDPVELDDASILLIEDWSQADVDIYQQTDYIWLSATQINMYGASSYFRLSTSRDPVFSAYFFPLIGIPENDEATISTSNYIPAEKNRVEVVLTDTLERFSLNKQLNVDIQSGILKKTVEFDCYPASVFFRNQYGIDQFGKLLTLTAEPPFMQIAEAVETDGRTSETDEANECVAPSLQISSHVDVLSNESGNYGAAQYCEDYAEGGFNDWRVPTLAEMKLIRMAREEALSRTDTTGVMQVSSFFMAVSSANNSVQMRSGLAEVEFEPYQVPAGAQDMSQSYLTWQVPAGSSYVLPEGSSLTTSINMSTNTKYYIAGDLTITGIWGTSALFVVSPTGSVTFQTNRLPAGMIMHNHGDQVLPNYFTIGANSNLQVKGDMTIANLTVEGNLYVQGIVDGGINLSANQGAYIRFGHCAYFSGDIYLTNNTTLISETCLTANDIFMTTNASLYLSSGSILECNDLELANSTCEVEGGDDSYAVLNILGSMTVHHDNVDEMFGGLLDIHCDDIVNSSGSELEWEEEVIFNGDTYIPATDCREEFGTPPNQNEFFNPEHFPVGNYWTAKPVGTAWDYYVLPVPEGNEISITLGDSAYVRCVRTFQ
ncbi:MAG: hypothetical protein WCS66_01800 [Bacteroidales bacterium]